MTDTTSEEIPSVSVHSFEDEDNNPFSHTLGLTSMIKDEGASNSKPNGTDGDDLEDSILLYKSTPSAAGNGNTTAAASHASGIADGSGGATVNSVADTFNQVHINYESRVTKLLRPNNTVRVQITEASNSNEGILNSLKKYVVYTIKLTGEDNNEEEDVQTRRRYSDFESLREVLTKIFPLVIIPPIPPKNYFNLNVLNGLVSLQQTQLQPVPHNHPEGSGNPDNKVTNGGSNAAVNGDSASQPSSFYTYINSNHLSKHKLVEHRKRLLTNFLNNCMEISKIRNLEFFAKFLDPNANWTDEIALITSQLPKSVYQLNPENGLQTDPIYVNLPLSVSSHSIPSFLRPLKRKVTGATSAITTSGTTSAPVVTASTTTSTAPAVQTEEEDLSVSIDSLPVESEIDTTSLDEINKKIMENFIGLSNDYTELGSIFNSFSLILADTSSSKKTSTRPDSDIKLGLIFDKIGQLFDRSYITLNSLIGDLETKFSEPLGEAVRYTRTLQTINKFKDRKVRQSRLLDREVDDKKSEYNDLLTSESEASRLEQVSANGLIKNTKYDLNQPLEAKPSSNNGGKYRMIPMFKKITQYVSEIIDQNPEETRKQRLITLSSKIEILEKCQTRMLEDISYISDELNSNFKSFQKIQLKMIYDILLCYNGFLVDWAKKNVEVWEEIREEVRKL